MGSDEFHFRRGECEGPMDFQVDAPSRQADTQIET